MKILNPFDDLTEVKNDIFSVFLGGSVATEWRSELLEYFDDSFDIIFMNPVNKNYDQTKEDLFKKQTDWEHTGLLKSTINTFYFSNKSLAPITLAEIGFYRSKDFIVCLEDGYEREAYVKYIVRRYGKPMVSNVKELSQLIKIRYMTAHHLD